MPDVSRWRSPSAYDYVEQLSPADMAWEFLRRNRDYQRDYARTVEDGDAGETAEAIAARWGLRFPDRSGAGRDGSRGVLDPGDGSRLGPAGLGTGRARQRGVRTEPRCK